MSLKTVADNPSALLSLPGPAPQVEAPSKKVGSVGRPPIFPNASRALMNNDQLISGWHGAGHRSIPLPVDRLRPFLATCSVSNDNVIYDTVGRKPDQPRPAYLVA